MKNKFHMKTKKEIVIKGEREREGGHGGDEWRGVMEYENEEFENDEKLPLKSFQIHSQYHAFLHCPTLLLPLQYHHHYLSLSPPPSLHSLLPVTSSTVFSLSLSLSLMKRPSQQPPQHQQLHLTMHKNK